MKNRFDIGIIGGMGPKASSKLLELIIDFTYARRDQEYPRTIVLSDSIIPDRTDFLLNYEGSKDPLPYLKDDLDIINNVDATTIGIACNTAHYFYDKLAKDSRIKIINMVEVSLNYCSWAYGNRKIVVLCTSGTRKTGIFEKNNTSESNIVYPSDEESRYIHNIIYSIKQNKQSDIRQLSKEVRAIIQNIVLREGNNVCFLIGCTELSLLDKEILFKNDYPHVDALEILALSLISSSGFKIDINQNRVANYKSSFFKEFFNGNK